MQNIKCKCKNKEKRGGEGRDSTRNNKNVKKNI
jgi:hypothetical protein